MKAQQRLFTAAVALLLSAPVTAAQCDRTFADMIQCWRMSKGKHSIQWDTNESQPLENGLYLCRLSIGDKTFSYPLLRLE